MGMATVRGGVWREEVLARAGRLDQAFAAQSCRHPPGMPPDFGKTQISARTARVRVLVGKPVSLRQWWSGIRVEDCWTELRLAEEGLLYLTGKDSLYTNAYDALNHARFYLPVGDRRVEHLQYMTRLEHPDRAELRSSILPVLSGAHEASDNAHRALRNFQNQVRVLAAGLLALAMLAALVVFLVPDLSLMPGPGGISQGWALVLTLAAGGLGALFSAIPSLAQVPETAVLFNPIREQAALKVVVGMWSGVVGLLVVSAGLEQGTAGSSTVAGLFIVAALFGSSQEALTRFADHKASTLRDTSA